MEILNDANSALDKISCLIRVTGTDLRISGNPAAGSNNYNGIHYARHQIGFTGNPDINEIVIG